MDGDDLLIETSFLPGPVLVTLRYRHLDILRGPLPADGAQHAPDEAPVRPAALVHLLARQVFAELGVVLDEVPNVLDGELLIRHVNLLADNDLTSAQNPLLFAEDSLQKTKPAHLLIGQPPVSCSARHVRGLYLLRSLKYRCSWCLFSNLCSSSRSKTSDSIFNFKFNLLL